MRHVCPECGASGDAGTCETDGAARVPAGADALLGTTIGSWRVARAIGAGGIGRVYLAVQPKIGARVAIKVLKRESAADQDVIDRFFNEARAVNVIKHENIVDIIDLGRLPDGAPYIVMEYLDGASLGAIVRQRGATKRLSPGTAARLVGEVLSALEAAHAKGIIHRDLKPDNVFVSPSGRVTVLDFGIAKLAREDSASNPTQTGSLLGTPAYMSPEQARSQPLDARSDLYSTGVILYEATTGVLPFAAANLFDMLQQHVTATPESPRARNAEIPSALDAVILRALDKDPAKRFATASEMKRALLAAVEGLPQIALASIELPPDAIPTAKQPSDPFAPTAAGTIESLARGETMPSSPPAKQPAKIEISRGMLFAMIGGGALLAIGAVIAVVVAMKSDATQQAVVQPPQMPTDAATVVPAVDAAAIVAEVTLPPDAAQGVRAPDAGHGVRPQPAPLDAGQRVQRPDSGNGVRPRPAGDDPYALVDVDPPADGSLPASYRTLKIANRNAFDPYAYYRTAYDIAKQMAGGGKVALINTRWHQVDRTGHIDLDAPKSGAQYDFLAIDLAKSGTAECMVGVQIEGTEAHAYRGSLESAERCKAQSPILPPHCSVAVIWQKAAALGQPASATHATFAHNYARGWHVSSDDGFSEMVDDDCP